MDEPYHDDVEGSGLVNFGPLLELVREVSFGFHPETGSGEV